MSEEENRIFKEALERVRDYWAPEFGDDMEIHNDSLPQDLRLKECAYWQMRAIAREALDSVGAGDQHGLTVELKVSGEVQDE